MDCVEKWGVFELSFLGKCDGNPYIDYSIKAEFSNKNEQIITDGFYDGDGIYRVRFMPSFTGEYSYLSLIHIFLCLFWQLMRRSVQETDG